MTTETIVNRYLTGSYAPIRDEQTRVALTVEGHPPTELTGTYLRIGPNPIDAPHPDTYHWFQGDGMVHAVTLSEGHASYSNRWVRTDRATRVLDERTIGAQPPDVIPDEISVANTGLIAHAGRILTLYEVALPVEIRRDATTIGRYNFDGRLQSAMTAHPKIDPSTGDLHFFGYNILGPPYLRYHVADATGRLTRTEEITIPGASMVHDFAITERHIVWLDLPVLFDLDLVNHGHFPYKWHPDYGARIGLMPRAGTDGDVRWFDIDPCYVFHVLNAYDDDSSVVIDVVRYDRLFADDHTAPSDADPILTRWTVDLATAKVASTIIDDRPQEFPRVADRTVGTRHRYGYAVTEHDIVQHDLDRGSTVVHPLGENSQASEALFVPAPDGRADDEGWIVAIVHHDPQPDEFLVLDATALDKPPVARIQLPQRVPLGFHALWLSDGG
jgi:carotenoid cleavage dioxygenase-like enzyme